MSAEDYRLQGSIIPKIFVGIGGVGSRIVDRIAKRANGLPNWKSQLAPLTSFVSIDTNELDQQKLRHVPLHNQITIGAFDRDRIIEVLQHSEVAGALAWLGAGHLRPTTHAGAGQLRIESRLGFFYHSSEIRNRFRRIMKEMLRPQISWRQDDSPKFDVRIFCTLAGGTGSGVFLSAAYLISALIREQKRYPAVVGNLLLSTLMKDRVGAEIHTGLHANTYAALKELEYLTKLDYPEVRRSRCNGEEFAYLHEDSFQEQTLIYGRPFFLAFLFDQPSHLDLPDPEAAVADAAFFQSFSPIWGDLAAELDNYEKTMEELTRLAGDADSIELGYTKSFGAYGAVGLVLPARDLVEYSALRFAAEILRSRILPDNRLRYERNPRLFVRLKSLAHHLENEAEQLRCGEVTVVPPLALKVEIFETLDEPATRIWDQVYVALFADEGRQSGNISAESFGTVIDQTVEAGIQAERRNSEEELNRVVEDLRHALVSQGREQCSPALFGDGEVAALDLATGLDLEARLVLEEGNPSVEKVRDEAIEAYRQRKLRALAEVAGVFARIKTAEARFCDDGVKASRSRVLLISDSQGKPGLGSRDFIWELRNILAAGSRSLKVDCSWNDPHLAIVHDHDLPIPLYYFLPVTAELEDAYRQLTENARRAYRLHTDFRFEEGLPNLNPLRPQVNRGWALRALANGLLTQIIRQENGLWVYQLDKGPAKLLGRDLSSTLFEIGTLHLRLEQRLSEARKALKPESERERRRWLADEIERLLEETGLREISGEITRLDALDRPILRALRSLFTGGEDPDLAGERTAPGWMFDRSETGSIL